MRGYLALTEKLYRDDYTASQIADALNENFVNEIPVTEQEVERWIKDYGYIRRPEPKRGERLTPEPPPREPEEWEPMFKSWMD